MTVCYEYSHPHTVTNTRCCIDTVISPDDGHIVARNMYRKEINILRKIVHKFGFIYKISSVYLLSFFCSRYIDVLLSHIKNKIMNLHPTNSRFFSFVQHAARMYKMTFMYVQATESLEPLH